MAKRVCKRDGGPREGVPGVNCVERSRVQDEGTVFILDISGRDDEGGFGATQFAFHVSADQKLANLP